MNEKAINSRLEDLYNRITGDEDARVCKDIPDAACNDQPRNFFAYLLANLLGKVADEISSAKLVIPWLFGLLGVCCGLLGFLSGVATIAMKVLGGVDMKLYGATKYAHETALFWYLVL